MVRKQVQVNLNLRVDITKVNFLMVNFMVSENIILQILANCMRVNLKKIIWMEKE